jgi:SnoaL-like domain
MDMDDVERLLDERACERLVLDYARWLDTGDRQRFGALFANDAVWDMPGYARLEGPEAIVARLARADRPGTSRHLVSNLVVDVVSADEAVGYCQFVNYRNELEPTPGTPLPAGEPSYVGRYLDRYVRTPEGWRFARRRVELDFASRTPSATRAQ